MVVLQGVCCNYSGTKVESLGLGFLYIKNILTPLHGKKINSEHLNTSHFFHHYLRKVLRLIKLYTIVNGERILKKTDVSDRCLSVVFGFYGSCAINSQTFPAKVK